MAFTKRDGKGVFCWSTCNIKTFKKYFYGFALNDERFIKKNKYDYKYFDELLEQIREMRLSERRFYQKITDIYATSMDYAKKSPTTIKFFKKVQNKLHFVICFQAKLKIKSQLNKDFNTFTIRKKRVQMLIIY